MALGSTTLWGKVASVAAAAAVSVGATVVLTGGATKAITIGPRAWFDEPLDGSYYDAGPVAVVAHAADPDGVVEVVLAVDGKVTATLDAGGEQLVEVHFDWDPPGDGTYELRVVGVDNQDQETQPDTVIVHIGEDPSEVALEDLTTTTQTDVTDTTGGESTTTSDADPATTGITPTSMASTSSTRPGSTTTLGSTTTTRPTTTTTAATTTTAPCPGTVTNSSPASGASVSSNPTLTWGYSGCPVAGFVVQVTRDANFARIDQETFIDWPDRSAVADASCSLHGSSTWYWRVRTEGPAGGFSRATSFNLVCRAR